MLTAPNSTKSGQVKIGYVTLNSLLNRDDSSTISITDLYKSVTNRVDIKDRTRFTLQSGVVNHSLANGIRKNIGVGPAYTEEMDYGGEVVAFAIITKAF